MSFYCRKCNKLNNIKHSPLFGESCNFCGHFEEHESKLPIYKQVEINNILYNDFKKDIIDKIFRKINETKD